MFSAALKSGAAATPSDPDFEYVTMLLHGDGTNGAQNNTFLDSSTNNFTITRNGNTTQGSFSPYGPNWSNYFAGSGNYLTVNTSTGTGTWTAECWVFIASPANDRAIFGQGTSDNTGGWLFWVDANGTIRLYSNGNIAISSSGAVASNTWVHLALVSNSSNVTIYVNGTSVATGSYSGKTFTNTPFQINRGYGGPTAGIDGYISNARLVVGTAVYTSNFTPPTTPLAVITNTSLLTCADNRFIDDSTNNFVITVVGTPSVQRFSPFAPTAAYNPATIGGSGYFDGSGDWLTSSASSQFAFGTGDFTMEAYVYVTGGSGYRQIYSTRQGGATGGSVAVNPSGGLTYYDTGFVIDYTTPIPTQQWIHVALARSGSTIRLFLNGVQIGSASNSTNLTSTGFAIGANVPGDESFVGYISNVRVVKGTAVYTSNFTPPASPLTAIANTSLLANFTNGAIFDNAMMNDLETVGNAQISTSVVKFGTGSLAFDGTGDYLTAPLDIDLALGTGDFTAECWVYLTTNASLQSIFNINQFNTGILVRYDNSSNGYALFLGGTQYNSSVTTVGQWVHLAATRASGTVRFFVNGTQTNSASNTYNVTGATFVAGTAAHSLSETMTGYIDDLRITKGVARYTATFTPPTAAFPDR